MRHQRHRRSLGVTAEHRKAMLANLVVSLVTHNRLETTHARAKEASKFADKMITLGKRDTLHARRQIISALRSKTAAKKLIEDFVPLFKERQGGYTRVVRYRKRAGDNAQLAILEFTEFPEVKEVVKKKAKKVKKEKPSKPETTDETTKVEKKETREKKPKKPAKKAEDVVEKKSKKSNFFGALRRFGKK